MACEDDPYVYVYEDGYTSDEEDISDSLVSGIVEEAFRKENPEGNMNPTSQGRLYPSDSDLDSAPLEFRHFGSDECFPMIKITDDACQGKSGDRTSHPLDTINLNDTKPRCTASDGFLPEKTVRFTPTTSSASNGDKKKYPTTPKNSVRNLGPSLSPMKPPPCDSSSTPEEEVSGLTCLNCFPDSPCDMSPHNPSPCSPAPITGQLRDADSNMMNFEEELIKLNCLLADMEAKLLKPSQEQDSAHKGSGTKAPGRDDLNRTSLERDMQEILNVIQSVSMKWTIHKRNLDDCMTDTHRLEGEYFMMGHRLKEQSDIILKLKEERHALEEFLQEKEYEWFLVKKSIRADSSFIRGLVKEAKHCKDMESMWKILDSFLLLHFDREKAIALDSAKQNKISELRLLICRQQLHLAEVEDRNRELEWEIRHQAGLSPLSSADCNSSCLKDVLYCDHSWYSPLCSTNPEFASLHIHNIGGPHSDLAYERKQPVSPASMFFQKVRGESASDLAEYDRILLKELTEHGPGSKDFRLE